LTAFENALEALDEFGAGQGATREEALTDDNFEQLRFRWSLTDVAVALERSTTLMGAGATVVITLTVDATQLTLTSDSSGAWVPSVDPATVFEHLEGKGPRASWATADLLDQGYEESFAAITDPTATVEFEKKRWTRPIETDTGRSVWIGPSCAGFAKWLRETKPSQIAQKLFSQPGALVLVAGDAIKLPADAGERFTIGGLATRAPSPSDRASLRARLEEHKKPGDLPQWRMVDVEPGQSVRLEVRRPLARAAGVVASRLIAEETAGEVRPSREHDTVWELPAVPGDAASDVAAVLALARWVASDLTLTRMSVAQDVAARRLKDPLQGGVPKQLVDAAVIAHKLLVQKNVIESLERQQKLEESFRDLDEKAAEMRSSIESTLDASVTKALAGALAITIAALTSAKVRDWPATIAAFVLAGYLLISAAQLSSWREEDADVRLRDAGKLAAGRLEDLGDELVAATAAWRTLLTTRTSRATKILRRMAVLLAVGGLVANVHIRTVVGLEHHEKPKAAIGSADTKLRRHQHCAGRAAGVASRASVNAPAPTTQGGSTWAC
jgi:hypothetical protein